MGQSIEVQDRDEHGVWKEIRQWLPSGKKYAFHPKHPRHTIHRYGKNQDESEEECE